MNCPFGNMFGRLQTIFLFLPRNEGLPESLSFVEPRYGWVHFASG